MPASVTIALTPAPSTPLNLAFDTVYAPRAKTPPFVGYMATERDGQCEVWGYRDDGGGALVFAGALLESYVTFAKCLRMDLAP